LGTEADKPQRREHGRHGRLPELLTACMILVILVSSFAVMEISRGQLSASNSQAIHVVHTSPSKIATPPSVSSSRHPPVPSPGTTPAAAQAAGPASGWRLTWSDEFNGHAGSPPDASKWGNDTGGSGWGNSELEYYTHAAANAALDGRGNLVITARTAGASGFSCWYGRCRYTSARLITLGRFSQAYGRISARIKLPTGQGIWPSFWALGDNIASAGWPQAGQLDILSSLGNTPATVSAGLLGPHYNVWSGDSLNGGTFADAYHTFTADWYPDHISFFVDGHLFGSQYRAKAGAGWVFDHPFFLIINLAVGGKEPGNPDASTTFPKQMLVDWVRVYKAGPPAVAVSGRITGLVGKCAEVNGTAGAEIQLDTCNGSAAQTWTMGTGGTISALGGCLDVTGSANGTRPHLSACTAAATQTWQAQTNGQLVNLASGRCLDTTNNSSANLTPLQIRDCLGTPSQPWRLP